MTRPSFLEGVLVAVVASLTASVSAAALGWLSPTGGVLRLVTAGLGLGYVLYLLARSGARVGRVTTVVAWTLAAGGLWLLYPPALSYLLAHLGLVSVVRSVHFHGSALAALADAGLVGAGLAAGIWAALASGSVLLSVWCFFLLQALFPAIPARLPARAGGGRSVPPVDDPFDRAHRSAELALRRLSR